MKFSGLALGYQLHGEEKQYLCHDKTCSIMIIRQRAKVKKVA